MIVYVVTANKGALNLRSTPKTSGQILEKIPYGTQLDATSEGEWSKVQYKGKTGYVKTEFLSVSKDTIITKDDLKKVYDSLQQVLKTIENILK